MGRFPWWPLLLVACAPPAPPPADLRVAAAASLSVVVPRIAAAQGLRVESYFETSASLAEQIEQGAPVDVFLAADEASADHVIAAGFAAASDRVPFATDPLVVVVAGSSSSRPATLTELALLEHVAVAADEVPAGRAARDALAHEGLTEAMTPRLVDAQDVQSALARVVRGEAEAAIVDGTAARDEPAVLVAFQIPAPFARPVAGVAVALHGDHRAAALAFVRALREPPSQAILAEAGFGPAP